MSRIAWRALQRGLSTRQKIALARTGYRLISASRRMVGKNDRVVVRRGAIRWQLDINEGIDFSIYLLGAFERRLVTSYRGLVAPGATVLDIGANVGSHTLPLSEQVGPAGVVHALEPTDYAVGKLRANLRLNPKLEARVIVEQVMLVDNPDTAVPALPSSWPLDRAAEAHRELCSIDMPAVGAQAVRLDDYADTAKLRRVDFIKLDVDGNEVKVLGGGAATIRRSRPMLVLELAPYMLEAAGTSLHELVDTIRSLDLRLYRFSDGDQMPTDISSLRRLVPSGGSINVIARPG